MTNTVQISWNMILTSLGQRRVNVEAKEEISVSNNKKQDES